MNTTSIRSTALLLALAVLAVGGTVLWHQLTAQRITDAEQQLKAQRWLSVLPEQHYDNQPLQHPCAWGPRPWITAACSQAIWRPCRGSPARSCCTARRRAMAARWTC